MATQETGLTLERKFEKIEKQIMKAQQEGNGAMLKLAAAISLISDPQYQGYIERLGYKNAAAYLTDRYGISKSASYDAIRVIKYFADDSGKIVDDMKDYTYTQLKYIAQAYTEDKNGMYLIPMSDIPQPLDTTWAMIRDAVDPATPTREIQKMFKKRKAIEDMKDKSSEPIDTTAREIPQEGHKENCSAEETGVTNPGASFSLEESSDQDIHTELDSLLRMARSTGKYGMITMELWTE